jgi:hypothetical protein
MTDPANRLQDGKEICMMVHIPPVKEQKVSSKGKRTLCSEHKAKKPALNDQIAVWNLAELFVSANTTRRKLTEQTQRNLMLFQRDILMVPLKTDINYSCALS